MDISTFNLTDNQTQVLLAMLLAPTSVDAYSIMQRSTRSAASGIFLAKAGLIVTSEGSAIVSDLGRVILKTRGFIDGAGELTEYGQKYYQSATEALNEFIIIRTLLSY